MSFKGGENSRFNEYGNLLTTINDPFELVADLQEVYHDSYRQYVGCLKEKRVQEAEEDSGHTSSVAERLVHAFQSLDNDISRSNHQRNLILFIFVVENH